MSNIDLDKRLEEAMSNPEILKALQKLLRKSESAAPSSNGAVVPKKVHEIKESYVNVTQSHCSLCGANTQYVYVMGYDNVERCHRILYAVRPGFTAPAHLKVKTIKIISDNCDACFDRLLEWPKEKLIHLLINKNAREQAHFHSLEEIAKEVANGERE